MSDNQRVITVEHNLFSSFQSQYNKTMNSLQKMKRNISRKELVALIDINNTIKDLECKLLDLNYRFVNPKYKKFSNLKNLSKLSKKDIEMIKEHDDNEEIIKKFLPMMMFYKMHQDGMDIEMDESTEELLGVNYKPDNDVNYVNDVNDMD